MKTTTSKTKNGNNNTAEATLADINNQIEALKQQRTGLAEPLKGRYTELRTELLDMETQIRELDPLWRPVSLRPKADDKIREVIEANGAPMTEAEILKAVGDAFTKWKVRTTLKKRFMVDGAGKYSVKAAA